MHITKFLKKYPRVIFHFLGAGNPQYVAETIVQGTEAPIIFMSDWMRNEACTFTLKDNERVGFVFL